MLVLRPLLLLLLCGLPFRAATFGTVVAHAQPLADLALDEARKRLYVVNTASSQVEVYSTASSPPKLSSTIKTDGTPLAIAVARSGKYLYVACYGSSALDVVDLTSANFTTRTIALAAPPQGLAVGIDDKVLIGTSGTTSGQDILITYDPSVSGSQALQGISIGPAAPSAPTLPAPGGVMALASHSRLQASQDGRTIVGVNETTTTRTVFVYDVNSSTVLGSRTVPAIAPVVAVSADGARFLSGPMLFDAGSMTVLAQENTSNSPFVFPAGVNFNTQTVQGGAVFAQLALGATLIAGYNIVPVASPAAKSNTAQLLFHSPDNLMIQMGVQLPENLGGKMVISSDNATIYAVSQSGFMVLPVGALTQSPIAIPDTNVALLASDQCGVTAALNSAVIPVRNAGGKTFSATAQILASASTSTSLRVTGRAYGGDVTAQFSSAAARSLGTVAPDQILIQSPEAINIIPTVRVFQNNRNAESRGAIVPIDTGAGSLGLTDMVADTAHQRVYIANPGLNRIEVFDTSNQQLLAPIGVGQLPRSLAFGTDPNLLYVANSGGESISIVDLSKGAVTGKVNYPPVPFGATFAVITPMLIASSQREPQVLMSDGTLWKIVGSDLVPRALNAAVFGTTKTIPGPAQTMTSTPDGAYVVLLAGNGAAYLYDSSVDDFVSTRQVLTTPVTGYFGPVGAAASGQYFLIDDQVVNQALTPMGNSTTGSRPVSAVVPINAQSYARFTTAVRANATVLPADAGQVEIVDAANFRITATFAALESPLAIVAGNTRANVSGRTMVMDPASASALVLTASGLSVIPLNAASQAAPQLNGTPLVNAANQSPAVAPGGLVSILGKNLAANATSGGTPLPTMLGGVCVTLNNAPIPLQATSATQINAQIPFTLTAGRYPLVVRSIANLSSSATATVTVARYAPAIFLDSQGPAIFHADGNRVDRDHPASRDEPLTIYATGLGVTTGGKVTTGNPSPADPLAVTAAIQLYFGNPLISDSGVIVDWSGLAPGMLGVYQIRCRIPGTHLKGDALPVTLRIGGLSSPTTGPAAAVVYVN